MHTRQPPQPYNPWKRAKTHKRKSKKKGKEIQKSRDWRVGAVPTVPVCSSGSVLEKTFLGRVRLKIAQGKPRKKHEKAMEKSQTLSFQADEGHGKATRK